MTISRVPGKRRTTARRAGRCTWAKGSCWRPRTSTNEEHLGRPTSAPSVASGGETQLGHGREELLRGDRVPLPYPRPCGRKPHEVNRECQTLLVDPWVPEAEHEAPSTVPQPTLLPVAHNAMETRPRMPLVGVGPWAGTSGGLVSTSEKGRTCKMPSLSLPSASVLTLPHPPPRNNPRGDPPRPQV